MLMQLARDPFDRATSYLVVVARRRARATAATGRFMPINQNHVRRDAMQGLLRGARARDKLAMQQRACELKQCAYYIMCLQYSSRGGVWMQGCKVLAFHV
jgi:hypothetical protein